MTSLTGPTRQWVGVNNRSAIDFGTIIMGKDGLINGSIRYYENVDTTEQVRLQILAGNRFRREAERQRIRVEREARKRIQFEALREKRAEEYRAEQQRLEAQRQYRRHLERHRQERLQSHVPPPQENREDLQLHLERGRTADKEAAGPLGQSFWQPDEHSEQNPQQ